MHFPIRIRLSLAFSVGMALVLAGMGTFVYLRTSADLLASVDAGLRSRAQILADTVGRAEEQATIGATGSLIDPDESFAQVLDARGRIVDASAFVERAPLLPPSDVASLTQNVAITRKVGGFEEPVRLVAVAVQRAGQRAVVVVGTNLGDTDDALRLLLLSLLTIGPAGLVLTAVAGWLLAGAALRPVDAMRSEAAAISASEPTRRLPVPATGDEVARLASTLNEMLDRLQHSMEAERRFVDDASHELRTPLATMQAEIDLTLSGERTHTELIAALSSIEEDVALLRRLAEDLLVLARSRGGGLPLRRAPTPLLGLIRECVGSVEGMARARDVKIHVGSFNILASVDPDRVRQAICNLLENAIQHSPRGGSVRVDASRDGDAVSLTVADAGPGFPPSMLDRAFEPFTRGGGTDQGREGTGLGLAIVRAVADAHRGTVRAENAPGGRVTMTMPG